MNFQAMPLSGLVNTLANILHTPVVDGTRMTVAPDGWPDLVLAAVRTQLGFKPEKQKAALEITVIDLAEQPTDTSGLRKQTIGRR